MNCVRLTTAKTTLLAAESLSASGFCALTPYDHPLGFKSSLGGSSLSLAYLCLNENHFNAAATPG
jgi:hypothetical protein